MPLAPCAIQVEILNPWYIEVIPVIALIASLFSIGLTLWFRFQEGNRLKIEVSIGRLTTPDRMRVLDVNVTNTSRQMKIEIVNITLRHSKNWAITYYSGTLHGISPSLPLPLDPGSQANFFFPLEAIVDEIAEQTGVVEYIIPSVTTSQKKYKGKNNSALSSYLHSKVEQRSPHFRKANLYPNADSQASGSA